MIAKRKNHKGAGPIILLAALISVVGIALVLTYMTKVNSELKIANLSVTKTQTMNNAELGFQKLLILIADGFNDENFEVGYFNGEAVTAVPCEDIGGLEIDTGCWRLTGSIELDPTGGLQHYAEYNITCRGAPCSGDFESGGAATIKGGLVTIVGAGSTAANFVVMAGKNTYFNFGFASGGDGAGGPGNTGGPGFHITGKLSKALIQGLEAQCVNGETAYTNYLEKYFNAYVCTSGQVPQPKTQIITTVSNLAPVSYNFSTHLSKSWLLQQGLISSGLTNINELFGYFQTCYPAMPFADASALWTYLRQLSDVEYARDVYSVLSPMGCKMGNIAEAHVEWDGALGYYVPNYPAGYAYIGTMEAADTYYNTGITPTTQTASLKRSIPDSKYFEHLKYENFCPQGNNPPKTKLRSLPAMATPLSTFVNAHKTAAESAAPNNHLMSCSTGSCKVTISCSGGSNVVTSTPVTPISLLTNTFTVTENNTVISFTNLGATSHLEVGNSTYCPGGKTFTLSTSSPVIITGDIVPYGLYSKSYTSAESFITDFDALNQAPMIGIVTTKALSFDAAKIPALYQNQNSEILQGVALAYSNKATVPTANAAPEDPPSEPIAAYLPPISIPIVGNIGGVVAGVALASDSFEVINGANYNRMDLTIVGATASDKGFVNKAYGVVADPVGGCQINGSMPRFHSTPNSGSGPAGPEALGFGINVVYYEVGAGSGN